MFWFSNENHHWDHENAFFKTCCLNTRQLSLEEEMLSKDEHGTPTFAFELLIHLFAATTHF